MTPEQRKGEEAMSEKLRPLAPGWEYASLYGLGAGPLGVWKPGTGIWHDLTKAPPQCFADAPEPLTLTSDDGEFKMKVWVKPCHLEAQIVKQPEGWRNTALGGTKTVVDTPYFSVRSQFMPEFAVDKLYLRGTERHDDNRNLERDFDSDSDRDAYLAKLQAGVKAMPRVEQKPEPIRANFPPVEYEKGFPVVKKPVEFAPGQWVECEGEYARVLRSRPETGNVEVTTLTHGLWILPASECIPCAPVVTDAMMILIMKSLLNGEKVRVVEHPADGGGSPYTSLKSPGHHLLKYAGMVGCVDSVFGRSAAEVECIFDDGGFCTVWPWNLEAADAESGK